MNWYFFFLFFAALINALNYYIFIRSLRRLESEYDSIYDELSQVRSEIESFKPDAFSVRFGKSSRWDISRQLVFKSPEEAKAFFDSVVKLNSLSPVKEPPSDFS